MYTYILFIFIAIWYFIVRIDKDYFILDLFSNSNGTYLRLKIKHINFQFFCFTGYGVRSGNLNFETSTTDNYEEDELQNTLYEK